MPRELNLTVLLAERRRTRGSEPLLTYYDLDSGERTELSGATFGNWVDKTANLLLEADVDPGDPIALELAVDHPGHWVTLVWCAAVWQVGGVVAPHDLDAAVWVIGPGGIAHPPDAELLLACSLHPFGLGFTPPLPPPLVDFGIEVRGFPDTFLGLPAGDGPGWTADHGAWTQSDLISEAPGDPDARELLRPTGARETVQRALLRPLRGTGSSVVVVGVPTEAQLAHLAATERTNA